MSKKKEPETEAVRQRQCLPLDGKYGILALFVCASISYSTYVVALGTNGYAPKIMLVPQALFAVYLAIYKFSKS